MNHTDDPTAAGRLTPETDSTGIGAAADHLILFKECIPYFEVLSDETRQRLVLVLAEGHESLNVGAITERLPLSRPAVSHHLKVLLQAGMVGFTRRGTENYYFLTMAPMIRKLKFFVQAVERACPGPS